MMNHDDAIEILENLKYPFPEYFRDIETNAALEFAIQRIKADQLRFTTISDCMEVKCSANCTHCKDDKCTLARIEVGNQSVGYPPCCYDFEDGYYASFKENEV